MSIKRSASATPSPSPSPGSCPTPKTKNQSPKTKTPSPKKVKSAKGNEDGTPSPHKTLDAEAKGELLDEIIAAGVRASDLGALAETYGIKKTQMVDMFKPNRSNLRKQAVKAVKGG